MANSNKNEVAQKRQHALVEHFKKQEHIMKWSLITAGAIILLLLLYIGYLTDWTRGLKTTSSLTPSSDSASNGSLSSPNGTAGSQGTTHTTTTGGTTTNNSTTTTNTTSNPPANSTSTDLTKLFEDTKVGDNLNDVVNKAVAEGITVDCSDDALLVRTCTFSSGNSKVQMRGLGTTGLITSVLQTN